MQIYALIYDKPYTSISKAFCMTGWRVGFDVCEEHSIMRLISPSYLFGSKMTYQQPSKQGIA